MSVYEDVMQGLREAIEIEKKRKEYLADVKNDRLYTVEEAEEVLRIRCRD